MLNKIIKIILVLILGYSGIISAGLGEKLSATWGRATATKEGQIGTAIVLTAVTVATCYGLYKLNLAFKEYYSDVPPKLIDPKLSDDDFAPLMRLAQRAYEHDASAELEQLIMAAQATGLGGASYVNQVVNMGVFKGTGVLSIALLTYNNNSNISKERQRNIISFIKVLLKNGINVTAKQAEHPALKLAQAALAADTLAAGDGGVSESKQDLAGASDRNTDLIAENPVVSTSAAAAPENTPAQNLALYFRLLNETNFGPEQYANNCREVERLLRTKLVDVNARDERGLSGLMIAIKNVNLAMVSCLLRHGADVRARVWFLGENLTPIMFLAFADTTIALYQEINALEIIKIINERELLLVQRDMNNGVIKAEIYAPVSPDDQKFKFLLQRFFPAEVALKFIRHHTATKHVIAVFPKERFSFRRWLGFKGGI